MRRSPYLYFATTSWNMGAALVPLLFVPLTETSDRMLGYFGAYIVFLIFLVPCGVAKLLNYGYLSVLWWRYI